MAKQILMKNIKIITNRWYPKNYESESLNIRVVGCILRVANLDTYTTREKKKNRAFLLNMVLEMNSETWRTAAGFFLAEEYIPGKRIRRWPRLSWVNDLVRDVACSSYLEMKMMADNRYEWKIPIHGLLHVTDCLDRKFHINKTNFLFVYQF